MKKNGSITNRLILRVFLCVLCDSVVSCSPPPSKVEQPPVAASPPIQETVSYLREDKKVHSYLCRPAGKGTFPAVVLIHDNMGLTDGIKDAAFRLAREQYVVLAVDLYRGQFAKTIKDAERLEREAPKERALGDLQAAVDYLSKRDEVRSNDLGVIGLGMGGGYAFEAALRDPRLHALVTCYGPLPTDVKRLASLNASVFGIFAAEDRSIPPETIAQFTTAMDAAGKRLFPLRVYGDCAHGFLDPAYWPVYGKPAQKDVEEAWDLIARYLDRTLM